MCLAIATLIWSLPAPFQHSASVNKSSSFKILRPSFAFAEDRSLTPCQVQRSSSRVPHFNVESLFRFFACSSINIDGLCGLVAALSPRSPTSLCWRGQNRPQQPSVRISASQP
jgi:hypothetical protein